MSLRWTASVVAAIGCVALSAHADSVILAPHIVMPDGSLKAEMGVLINDAGRIARIEPASNLADHPRALRLPDGAVLSPGLIDCMSAVGVYRANSGNTDAIDPDCSVVESFDPGAPDVIAALQAGITTVMLAPAFNGLIDGACATVRTATASGRPDVLNDECALAMGLGSAAFNTSLGPTSRSGALHLLRESFSAADQHDRIKRCLDGTLTAVVRAEEPEDASAMLRLLSRHDVVPVIVTNADATELAAELADYDASAIVGPYGFGSTAHVLGGAAALHDAGVTVAFTAGLPAREPDRLRITAALAVKYGMDADAARRAMTSNAADIAGVSDKVGSIAPRRAADLVVFSGDPLRLDSRVMEVWVQGRRVYRAPRLLIMTK